MSNKFSDSFEEIGHILQALKEEKITDRDVFYGGVFSTDNNDAEIMRGNKETCMQGVFVGITPEALSKLSKISEIFDWNDVPAGSAYSFNPANFPGIKIFGIPNDAKCNIAVIGDKFENVNDDLATIKSYKDNNDIEPMISITNTRISLIAEDEDSCLEAAFSRFELRTMMEKTLHPDNGPGM